MTNEANDQTTETAAADNPDAPNQPTAQAQPAREGRGELVKFGLLILVLIGVVVGVAWSRPLIFGHIIPAVMGENQPLSAEVGVGGAAEAADGLETAVPSDAAAGDVFLPTLTTNPESESASAEPAAEAPAEGPAEAPAEAPAPTAVPEPRTHIVQPGENLTKIAQQYNVSAAALLAANGLSNPNYIQAGQVLIIPNPAP
ncbi:MAG: LysM peptidoglycan-binding domain-containing protein [Chloroflexi bacterium]|nr:LysM peptidoglycan-binding domain-containing protein [Chloroflexota bacterium]